MSVESECRRKIMKITFGDLGVILRALVEGRWVTIDGVPEDAIVSNALVTFDGRAGCDCLALAIDSDTFDPVPEGGFCPPLDAIKVSDRTEIHEVAQAMIHDLKEESLAYARGVEDGKKEMFDLLKNSKVIGVYPNGRVLTRRQLLTPLIPMDNVKVVLSDGPADYRPIDESATVGVQVADPGSVDWGDHHHTAETLRPEEQEATR